jgi:hypothetical protein
MTRPNAIPRPLVRTNQWVIVTTVLLSLATHQPLLLLIPLIAGVLGLFTGFNPIMRFAKLFLHKPLQEYALEDREQQNFNQIIAVVCLSLSLLGYLTHIEIIGIVFSLLVALAAFIAILGFCIGCFLRFQWNQYRYRRSLRQS